MGWVKDTMDIWERRKLTESQLDVAAARSLHAKMTGPEAKRPDGIVEVTVRELKAMRSAEYQRLDFGKLD